MIIEVVTIIYLEIVSIYLFINRKRWLFNPSYIWVFLQTFFFVGTVINIDPDLISDRVLVNVMFFGLLSFLFGTLLVDLMWENSRSKITQWWSRTLTNDDVNPLIIWGLLYTSIAINILYYQKIGYNIFTTSIREYFIFGNGPIDNIATLRLSTYGTIAGRYLAPGYVNQFKNILLPMLSALLAANYLLRKNRSLYKNIFFVLLAILNIVFLLGTGQRAALVYALAIIVLFFWVVLPRHMMVRLNSTLLIFGVILFLIQTFFLGRAENVSVLNVNGISLLVKDSILRFTTNNQVSGIISFRYVYDLPIQHGSDWLKSLLELLPGQRQSLSLAKIIYELRYGSYRGTSPPSLWGSIWYNFGIMGIIIIPALLGFLYQTIYKSLFRGEKNVPRLLIYSAYAIILGTWAVSDPASLLNRGLGTVIILSWLFRRFHQTESRDKSMLSQPLDIGSYPQDRHIRKTLYTNKW